MADLRDIRGSDKARGSFELVGFTSPDDDFGSGFKVCSKCGNEKPLVEFHKGKAMCKMCRSNKYKEKTPNNDMVYQAMVDAAYRIIKERM